MNSRIKIAGKMQKTIALLEIRCWI